MLIWHRKNSCTACTALGTSAQYEKTIVLNEWWSPVWLTVSTFLFFTFWHCKNQRSTKEESRPLLFFFVNSHTWKSAFCFAHSLLPTWLIPRDHQIGRTVQYGMSYQRLIRDFGQQQQGKIVHTFPFFCVCLMLSNFTWEEKGIEAAGGRAVRSISRLEAQLTATRLILLFKKIVSSSSSSFLDIIRSSHPFEKRHRVLLLSRHRSNDVNSSQCHTLHYTTRIHTVLSLSRSLAL